MPERFDRSVAVQWRRFRRTRFSAQLQPGACTPVAGSQVIADAGVGVSVEATVSGEEERREASRAEVDWLWLFIAWVLSTKDFGSGPRSELALRRGPLSEQQSLITRIPGVQGSGHNFQVGIPIPAKVNAGMVNSQRGDKKKPPKSVSDVRGCSFG